MVPLALTGEIAKKQIHFQHNMIVDQTNKIEYESAQTYTEFCWSGTNGRAFSLYICTNLSRNKSLSPTKEKLITNPICNNAETE